MQYYNAEKGSLRKASAGRELSRTILHRKHLDNSMKLIGEILFGQENGLEKLTAVRPAGTVVVDDWACLKSMVRMLHTACYKFLLSSEYRNLFIKGLLCNLVTLLCSSSVASFFHQTLSFGVISALTCEKSHVQVRTFEASCGPLTQYGMKHMRAFANICNAGIDTAKLSLASSKVCTSSPTAGFGLWSPVTSKFSA